MKGYYLFYTKQSDLDYYKKEFDRVSQNMDQGKTPVYNELRSAKTMLAESFPYNLLFGVFSILAALLIAKIKLNETVMIAVVLCVNSFCRAIANYIFTVIKHGLRIQLCKRLHIEPSEKNIAVMESLEYQSV